VIKNEQFGYYSLMGRQSKTEASKKNIITIMTVLALSALLFSACGASERQGLQVPDSGFTGKMAEGDEKYAEENNAGNTSENTSKDTVNEQMNSADSTIPKENSSQAWEIKNTVFDILKEMSIDEKIGQLFIVGFEGTTPNNALIKMLTDKHVGGVILFKRNINNPENLRKLNNSLKEINSGVSKIPLFISVDEEGGRLSRMPEQLSKLPAAKSIGEINDENISYEVGSLIAQLTKSFGFNMNFAPVLDIWSNPENTVIGDRAYGTDPEVVLKNGVKVMEGIRDGGVIPVVKHFPGHGDTIVDSHEGLPVVNYDMDRLENFELVPFQSATNNNADAVMVAHILMRNIDPDNPATLSKILITDILREKMEFDGVVITDDMTMDAMDKNYNIGDAAVKAVLAGSDILLVCHDYKKQLEAINAVSEAVSDGRISEERLNESVSRILKLKDKYRLADRASAVADIDAINKKIDGLVTK